MAHAAGGHSAGLEVGLMAFSVAIAIIGIWAAWQTYVKKPGRAEELGRKFAGFYRVLWNKYYIDEIYNAVAALPASQRGERARTALFLTLTSFQFQVIR